jgi:hypothetical protein
VNFFVTDLLAPVILVDLELKLAGVSLALTVEVAVGVGSYRNRHHMPTVKAA